MEDQLLERRMRDWKSAEAAAREAERNALDARAAGHADAASAAERAGRLRRIADVVLADLLDDVHVTQPARASVSVRPT